MATKSRSNGIHVESSSSSGSLGADEIQKGRVGQVLQQFQIHEDTALAYKIQSKEIETHVSRNREQRKSVRSSVKTAKQTYLDEVKNAGVLPETSVAEIEQKEWLAEELHKRVEEQESIAKIMADRERKKDEEIALQIQHEEEKKLRYFEHKRHERLAKEEEEQKRLRRIMKELQAANISDNDGDYRQDIEEQEKVLLMELPETNEIITLADGTIIDAKQNEVQTEEQKKEYLQRRDEELAKVLQKQEDLQLEKQRNIREDFRKAIELQDREIAKHLQRQEKTKAEKRREKMRRGHSLPETTEHVSSHKRHLPTYHEAIGIDDVEQEESQRHDGNMPKPEKKSESFGKGDAEKVCRRSNSEDQISDEVWIPRDHENNTKETNRETDSTEAGHYQNIAETLDPTFQRTHRNLQLTDDPNDRQGSNKTAPIVPPVKRKASKDKGKKDKEKECKQQ